MKKFDASSNGWGSWAGMIRTRAPFARHRAEGRNDERARLQSSVC